jgi:hypothetical protein
MAIASTATTKVFSIASASLSGAFWSDCALRPYK